MPLQDLLARINDCYLLAEVTGDDGNELAVYPCGLVFKDHREVKFTDEQRAQIRAALKARFQMEVERWTN